MLADRAVWRYVCGATSSKMNSGVRTRMMRAAPPPRTSVSLASHRTEKELLRTDDGLIGAGSCRQLPGGQGLRERKYRGQAQLHRYADGRRLQALRLGFSQPFRSRGADRDGAHLAG